MGRKTLTNFDPDLSKVMYRCRSGGPDEFLHVICDFLKRTKFAKKDNVKAKEKIMQVLDEHMPSNVTAVKDSPKKGTGSFINYIRHFCIVMMGH